MNLDSIIFIHRRCFTQMQRKIETINSEKLWVYECPECHCFITCIIQVLKNGSVQIQNFCEHCGKNMNLMKDYVTPQRGIIYYRCQKCGLEILLSTLSPLLFKEQA
ncbi:MAG: hypothetical protein LUQ65_09055 [Candidatus Helarchaeota archaeon]|nr:hypothetical protein [Candidatus Helarchaeota archaeon]